MAPRAFAADHRDWFAVAEIEPGLHLVAEPGHVCGWLIAGGERSVLLDSGLGIADIAAAVAPMASAPVSVVNSHVHYDHVGGNELFERVEMHELAPDRIEAGTSEAELIAHREEDRANRAPSAGR